MDVLPGRTTRRAPSWRPLRALFVLATALALGACEPPPVPDVREPAQVLGAPMLLATPDGNRLILLTEQRLRRTEKRNRASGRLMVDGSVHFSVRRHELWALDPASLAVLWRRTLQEARPTAESVVPRLTGSSAGTIWWLGDVDRAVAASDGRALADAGPPPSTGAPADTSTATWQFHTGGALDDSGPLRLPGTDVALRAGDPDGYFRLHSPVHIATPAPLQLERIADEGARSLWKVTLPLARLHALSASDRSLVFFGMSDAGKVPGTEHEAQGSHVLVAVDIATGALTTLDIGRASLLSSPGTAPSDASARP